MDDLATRYCDLALFVIKISAGHAIVDLKRTENSAGLDLLAKNVIPSSCNALTFSLMNVVCKGYFIYDSCYTLLVCYSNGRLDRDSLVLIFHHVLVSETPSVYC
jgi:hypothetical protein